MLIGMSFFFHAILLNKISFLDFFYRIESVIFGTIVQSFRGNQSFENF